MSRWYKRPESAIPPEKRREKGVFTGNGQLPTLSIIGHNPCGYWTANVAARHGWNTKLFPGNGERKKAESDFSDTGIAEEGTLRHLLQDVWQRDELAEGVITEEPFGVTYPGGDRTYDDAVIVTIPENDVISSLESEVFCNIASYDMRLERYKTNIIGVKGDIDVVNQYAQSLANDAVSALQQPGRLQDDNAESLYRQ